MSLDWNLAVAVLACVALLVFFMRKSPAVQASLSSPKPAVPYVLPKQDFEKENHLEFITGESIRSTLGELIEQSQYKALLEIREALRGGDVVVLALFLGHESNLDLIEVSVDPANGVIVEDRLLHTRLERSRVDRAQVETDIGIIFRRTERAMERATTTVGV